MINLSELDKEIDRMLEEETSNSLTNWLINKRFGDLYKIIGHGKFVNMNNLSKPIHPNSKGGVFNQKSATVSNNPTNRNAA